MYHLNHFLNSVYGLLSLISAIVTLAGGVIYSLKKQFAKIDKVEVATKSLIADRMISLYYRCKEKGYAQRYEMETLKKLYEDYKALGGNSFVDECYKECISLPTKKM